MQASQGIIWIKQAPKAWFDKLHGVLLSLGFTSGKSDQSLFVKVNAHLRIYLIVYVDDILVTATDQETINHLIMILTKHLH